MTKNDAKKQSKPSVTGSLRSSLADDEPRASSLPKRPGSNVFNRMPPPESPPSTSPVEPRASRMVQLPTVRRRLRPSGFLFPLIIAAAGIGAGYVLFATTKSLPIALVCGGVGLAGAVFCHILLRDRVEIR